MRRIWVVLSRAILLAVIVVLVLANSAEAAPSKARILARQRYQETIVEHYAPYDNAFGNLNVGDCEYAAFAHLVLRQYPNATITTAEVVQAWHTDEDGNDFFLETTGFDGYKVSGMTPLGTPTDKLAGLDVALSHGGGVFAMMSLATGSYGGPNGAAHAYAVIGASQHYVVVSSWGEVLKIPRHIFANEVIYMFGLQWPST